MSTETCVICLTTREDGDDAHVMCASGAHGLCRECFGAHVRAGDVPKALHVYDRMQKEDNIMATEITFAVLIRACEEDGEFVKMADLLQQAKELLAREGKLVMDLTGGGGRGGSNGLF